MKFLRHILLLVLLLSQFHLISQITMELEKGDKAFDQLNLDEALFFFEIAHDQQPNDPAITRRIGNVYRRMGQLTVSAEWYKKTLDLDATNPLDMLYYAESLKSLQQYDEAIEWYDRYIAKVPDDKRAKSHLTDREYYKDLFADTLKYDMKSLKINNSDPVIGISNLTENNYLLSAINANQTSTNSKKYEYLNYLDIYQVTLTDENELTNPVRLSKSVNSKYNDGPAFFSPSDQTLYITRTNIRNRKPVLDKQGSANLKIYSSTLKDGSWSSALELKFNSDAYSTAHACLSKDGQFMYFVSNREGGLGGTDLYVAQRILNGWSEPINLGDKVNTEGNEMFPFLSNEGFLYFTSDGHFGLGGTDIFVSDNIGGQWQTPTNLGAPINSNHDDFALLYNKSTDKGFFCSNRNGRGNDDIFFYTHKKVEKMILAGTILANSADISLAGEKIRIFTTNTGMTTEQRLSSDQKFKITVDAGDQIEVYMANAQFFDTTKVVFSSVIANPIVDPFLNVGEYRVDMKRIPLRKGILSEIQHDEFESTSGSLQTAQLPEVPEQGNDKNSSLLKPHNTSGNLAKGDQSTLIVTNADVSVQSEKARLYTENIAFGDQLFRQRKYEDAQGYYREALKHKAKDPYAMSRIREVDTILAEAKNTTILTVQSESTIKTDKPKIDFASTPAMIDLEGLQINNVLFDYNKTFIRDQDKAGIDQVVQLLKENSTSKLLIKAYCDSRGSMTYNQSLSMSRAMAVQGYVIQKGIKRDRIQTESFGEQRPLNDCEDGVPCSEDQYEVNRRAELKIVAGDSPTK